MKRKRVIPGFTIVELLIVIVVISILATVSVVAYNGTTARARDSQRKQDVAAIVKALQLYKIDNGNLMTNGSGCGTDGNGGGYYNYEGTPTPNYPVSIDHCLQNKGYTNREIIDPSGLKRCSGLGLACFTYFKYDCGLGTYVYAHLEMLPQTSTDTDATCSTTLDTNYGMNYFVKVPD
jgi:prepilin-type N-terminal cleavage/methylation domain-containing protein